MADSFSEYHGIVKPEHGKDPWSDDYYAFVDIVDVDLKDSGSLSSRPNAADAPTGAWYEVIEEGIIYRNDAADGWVAIGHGSQEVRIPEQYVEQTTTGDLKVDNGEVQVEWLTDTFGEFSSEVTWNAASNEPTILLLMPQSAEGARLAGEFKGWRQPASSAATAMKNFVSMSTNSTSELKASYLESHGFDGGLDIPDLVTCTYQSTNYYGIRYKGTTGHHYPHEMEFTGSYAGNIKMEAVPLSDCTNIASAPLGGYMDVEGEMYEQTERVATRTWVNNNVSGGGETAEEVANLSVFSWNWIDVGNHTFSDLAQFIADNNSSTSNNVFILPEGTYNWNREIAFNNGSGTYEEPVPEGIAIIGKPNATISVDIGSNYPNSGSSSRHRRIFTLGTTSNPMTQVRLENLDFDVGNADGSRDAGIFRANINDHLHAENLTLTRRKRLNSDFSRNGDRFSIRTDCVEEDAVAVHKNIDLTAGDVFQGSEGSVGHAIPFASENGHDGTNYWINCAVAGYTDNGFYVRDGRGPNILEGCLARNCGGGHFRIGHNDHMRNCTIRIDGSESPATGTALWVQEPRGTIAEGIRIIAPAMDNEMIRVSDTSSGTQRGGVIRDVYAELGNTGEFVASLSGDAPHATFTIENMTVFDDNDGSIRAGSVRCMMPNITFRDCSFFNDGGRIAVFPRGSEVENIRFEDCYFRMNDMLVARLGHPNVSGTNVDFIFDGCKFEDQGNFGDLFRTYNSPSLERLVVRGCDGRDYGAFIGNDSLTSFNVGNVEDTLGHTNQQNNSY